uniref:hypothetical protein n=1 Tax=Flavobacterium sp. TaxID=239 RepID=UPI00404A3830
MRITCFFMVFLGCALSSHGYELPKVLNASVLSVKNNGITHFLYQVRYKSNLNRYENDTDFSNSLFAQASKPLVNRLTEAPTPTKAAADVIPIFVQFDTIFVQQNLNENIPLKGRLVGYNELIGEIIINY